MNNLLESLQQAYSESQKIKNGEKQAARITYYRVPDPKKIRSSMGMSQAKFALMLGISQRTLEGWEQGRRRPKGPARRLLEVAQNFPEAVATTAFQAQKQTIKNKDGSLTEIITYGSPIIQRSVSPSEPLRSKSVNQFGVIVVGESREIHSQKIQRSTIDGQENYTLST